MNKKLTKYETARLIGARALQLSMGAPLLIDLKEADLEKLNYDPVEIARLELEQNVLPIDVTRPMPKKTE